MRSRSSASTWLSIGAILAVAAGPAAAQTSPPAVKPDTKVYAYVEKMPQLPGGGGQAAIQRGVIYPSSALLDRAQGRAFVRFTIAADGTVQQVVIIKSFRADCDSAVVRAVRKLPRFEPGMQAGQPVAVSLALPVTFAITVTQLPPTTIRR